jgi:hypothetical protein
VVLINPKKACFSLRLGAFARKIICRFQKNLILTWLNEPYLPALCGRCGLNVLVPAGRAAPAGCWAVVLAAAA